MLKDFLARNADGTYKIVDILIKIAKYNGFDGWFINNEANGSFPNGTILDYNEMYQILKEFNYKVGIATDPDVKKLQIIYYRNDATVSKSATGYDDVETVKMTTTGYPRNGVITPTQVQLNFGETPDKTRAFLKENPNYHPSDLYTMIDEWSNAKYCGTYDFRQLAYALSATSGRPTFDPNVYTSFSSYIDSGTSIFGNYAYNWIKKQAFHDEARAFLFATQVSNLFNMIHYSGTNMFISDKDKGLQANRLCNDYTKLDPKVDFIASAFAADPRIKVNNKGPINDFLKQNIYDYESNNGYNSTSFGVGSLVQERTTLFDENQILNKSTNFSMGSGIKFVDRDEQGNAVVANDYPWTNRRLTDVLPTYQWKIYDETKKEQPLNINDITGMYDYDNVYKKGNSIAIGSGFDGLGKVLPAKWDQTKVYDWDIMGTNLSSNQHQVSFIYYDGSNNNSNAEVNFWITTTNQTTGVSSGQTFSPTKTEKLKDGWVKISFDLNHIGNVTKTNRISKIGLQIRPQTKNFKFNVGEFNIATATNQQTNSVDITNPGVEYAIKRHNLTKEWFNLRFSWKSQNVNNLNYYAIYYFADNKWYRVGETTQNYYFLKDLTSTQQIIQLMIKPVYNDNIATTGFVFNVRVS